MARSPLGAYVVGALEGDLTLSRLTAGFKSFVAFDCQRGAGVVVLSNAGTKAGVDDIALHLLAGAPLRQPPKTHTQIALAPQVLEGYVGRYALAPNFTIAITRDANRLFAQATGQSSFEIFAEASRDFFAKVAELQISFETDAQGRATELILRQNGVNLRAKRID